MVRPLPQGDANTRPVAGEARRSWLRGGSPFHRPRRGRKSERVLHRDSIRHLKIYVDTSGKAAGEFGIFGLPGTLLLDREGREIGRLTGPAEWDAPDMVDFISSHLSKQTGSVSSGVSMTVKTALYQQ